MSLDEFSATVLAILDRPVIDKTGITGKFDFHLVFAPNSPPPCSSPAETWQITRSCHRTAPRRPVHLYRHPGTARVET